MRNNLLFLLVRLSPDEVVCTPHGEEPAAGAEGCADELRVARPDALVDLQGLRVKLDLVEGEREVMEIYSDTKIYRSYSDHQKIQPREIMLSLTIQYNL